MDARIVSGAVGRRRSLSERRPNVFSPEQGPGFGSSATNDSPPSSGRVERPLRHRVIAPRSRDAEGGEGCHRIAVVALPCI